MPGLFVATLRDSPAAIALVHCLLLVHAAEHGQNGRGSKALGNTESYESIGRYS